MMLCKKTFQIGIVLALPCYTTKALCWIAQGFCRVILRRKKGRRPTLPPLRVVPSALKGLTALFGMGRGDPLRYSHPIFLIAE